MLLAAVSASTELKVGFCSPNMVACVISWKADHIIGHACAIVAALSDVASEGRHNVKMYQGLSNRKQSPQKRAELCRTQVL